MTTKTFSGEIGPPPDTLIPEVYVLWHPDCAVRECLARDIYAWLRPGNGLGPQVFYRSLPAPEAPPGGLPPPLPFEQRAEHTPTARAVQPNLQIVIALIDQHMVVSPVWRHWLEILTFPSVQIDRRFMPVALDSTAYNVPAPLRKANFLRPTNPTANQAASSAQAHDDAQALLSRSLLKQITEAMCRLMLNRRSRPHGWAARTPLAADESGMKVRIFLSHAKADGTGPTRRTRDYIYSKTQLAAFFDENDIPYSSPFADVLQGSVSANETAAMIAVRTARYAERPWCRRELSLFRRPTKETPSSPRESATERWRLNPVLVVEAMQGGERSQGIPEFGNVTSIRWDGALPDQEEVIVTTMLRDAMLAEFHAEVGRVIGDADNAVNCA